MQSQMTTEESPETTEVPTTKQLSEITTEQPETPATSKPPPTTQLPIFSDPITTVESPVTTQSDSIPISTTEAPTTATQSNSEVSTASQITENVASSELVENDSTQIATSGRARGGLAPGDFAAIGLGVLVLIIIILVVAGIISYKMKLCGGQRKKGNVVTHTRSKDLMFT